MEKLYTVTRSQLNIKSPYDPASEMIRPQPKRVSSFALGDARSMTSSSPPPGSEKGTRLSTSITAPNADRSRVLSVGRAFKICGDLLLLCGFFPEALKHYAEAGAIARANNDFIWHAAALEGIGVCLVFFVYNEMPFQIPLIAQSTSQNSSFNAKTVDRATGISNKPEIDLVDFLPDLHASLLALYQKSTTSSVDQVPVLVLAESSLRLANFLSAVNLAGGLNQRALTHLILGQSIAATKRTPTYPPRAEIAAWAMRAYQVPIDSLTLADKLHVFSGLASIMGSIGFFRRRAFFVREIILTLVPALVQARVTGAAGIGIHPAASLAIPEAQQQTFSREVLLKARQNPQDLSALIHTLLDAYRIPHQGNLEHVESSILSNHGWPSLKSTVLRDCISLCEAIPDLDGVIKYSTTILEISAIQVPRDEQVRLVANIPRILGIIKRSGAADAHYSYWDHYLLRGIVPLIDHKTLPIKQPIIQESDELTSGALQDPFLYNPYAKRSAGSSSLFLVQGEQIDIQIVLQNPFEFDINVDNIQLIVERDDCLCTKANSLIKARSVHRVNLQMTANVPGIVKLVGCRASVLGSTETLFPIRTEPSPKDAEKWHVDRGGIGRVNSPQDQTMSESLHTTSKSLSEVVVVECEVLPAAPTLSCTAPILGTGTIQVTILEGSESSLNIILANNSSTPVTFIRFSFSDSTTKPLEVAINSRTKQAHERFELETFLYNRKAMTYDPVGQADSIDPSSSKQFHIDMFGKRGFVTGEIIVTYGYLPPKNMDQGNDSSDFFYTRSLVIPIKVDLLPALEIRHCDLLPLPRPRFLPEILLRNDCDTQYKEIYERAVDAEKYCLMVLDIRNSHTRDIQVKLTQENTEPFRKSCVVAGQSQGRLLVPVKRVSPIELDRRADIPSLTNRQFVVSSISPEQEWDNTSLFWTRETLLKNLQITWQMDDIHGRVETRSIMINKRMMKTLLVDDISISLIASDDAQMTDVPFVVRLQLHNYTEDRADVWIRILIVMASGLDLEPRLMLIGTSQFPQTLEARESCPIDLNLVSLGSGNYKVEASLEILNDGPNRGSIVVAPNLFVEVVDPPTLIFDGIEPSKP